jgi:hypothetical protein
MGSIFGMPTHERTRMAIVSVDDSIIQIKKAEDKLKSELYELALHVRRLNATHKTKKPDPEITANFLRRSRAKRQQMTSLHKKLVLLETQKDTLHASEVNQQVFSSMQSTSAALKSIGLDKTLSSVDEVMQELEESSSDVRAIQDGLGNETMFSLEVSDADLQEELQFLLDDDFEATRMLQTPHVQNKMHVRDSTESRTPVANKVEVSEDSAEVLLAHAV